MEPKEEIKPTAEDLLKSIDAFLDKEMLKVNTKTDEDNEEEEVKKAKKQDDDEDDEKEDKMKAKKAKMQEDDEEEGDDEEEKAKKTKKAKKGYSEGGEDNFKTKKSFDDNQYEEYMSLKKAQQDAELVKERAEKEELQKSLSGLEDMVKGLKDQIETIAKQPAAAPKSVDGLKVLQKGLEGLEDRPAIDKEDPMFKAQQNHIQGLITKAKAAEVLFQKGVVENKLPPEVIAEWETVGRIKDPHYRNIAKSLIMKAQKDGEF